MKKKKKEQIQNSIRKVRAAAHVFQAVGQMLECQPKYFKDPSQSENVDPKIAYRNHVYQGIKNALSLALADDGNIKIDVDNIFQLLRTLGLNPQSELVVDLVREASIETFGDINPMEFERVVLSLVKDLDEQLWTKRLDEKEHLRRLAKANEAKLEAERQRLDQAGFQKTEKTIEWEEYERQNQQQEMALQREMKEDELYDNMKMAFRLIDADEDGEISTQDMYQLMMALGDMMTDDELFGMINMVDLDCDGKITFEDFKQFLLPRSGDESLVHSPEAFRDNNAGNQQVDIQANEITAKSRSIDITTAEVRSDKILDPVQSTTDSTVGLLEADCRRLSDDEKQALDNRKRSLLYWNRCSPKTSSTVSGKPPQTTKASVTPNDDKIFLVKSESNTVIKKETQGEHSVNKSIEESGEFCQLQSIRQHGEHSNMYEPLRCTDNTDIHACTSLIQSSVETNRKQFSRKNHSNIVNQKFSSDSFEISDEKTTNLSSEIRDQPKNSDISEANDEVLAAPQSFTVKRNSQRSSNGSFVYDEDDDEDMVEAHYVQESLSRVSSTESLNNLNEVSERILPNDNHHIQSAFECTRNFVRNRIELEPTVEKLKTQKQIDERLNRAFILQKTILKRSLTAPSLTLHTSNKEQLRNARPQLNAIACSHIDIDLMCESPPKADIMSCSQFSAPVQSVRTSRNENEPSKSFADTSDTLNSGNFVSPSADSNRWPVRSLTRSRSSNTKQLYPPPENKSNLDTSLNVAGIAKLNKSNIQKALPRRAASATPFRQSFSCSTSIQLHPLKRPQTANMPYTARRKDSDELFEKLLTEPLSNSDELYPNKSLLTAFHHGFKSFWPTGRKINVIKNNLTLELNSYSRAIERNQFPFKSNQSKPICQRQSDKGNQSKPIFKQVQ